MGDGESEADRDPIDSDAIDPDEAFHLVGHEARVEMLLALARAPGHALTFSELRDRVGVRDSGQFSYHLSKLVGRFVDHEGDAYELLYAGHRVVDAIRSGVFHERVDFDSAQLDANCFECESPLVFEYTGHVAAVRCPSCESTLVEYPFDPGGVADRSVAEVAEAFDRRTRGTWNLARSGVCPTCAGTVTSRLVAEPRNSEDHYAADHPVVAFLDCRQCSFFSNVPVGGTLLSHPAVVSHFYERGVDLRTTPLWDQRFVVDGDRVSVRSTEPLRAAVTISTDEDVLANDDGLRLVLNDSATVRTVER